MFSNVASNFLLKCLRKNVLRRKTVIFYKNIFFYKQEDLWFITDGPLQAGVNL